MKRLRCPKCDYTLVFDETRYQPGQRLVFTCPACGKEFAIRLTSPKASDDAPASDDCGSITVIENRFCHKQIIPLKMGDNVIGRYVKGSKINVPIETVDPSIDTTHCIIQVKRNKQGKLMYILRDAPSNTGTFYMNEILKDNDRIRLEDGAIVTIGATTLILRAANEDNGNNE